MLESAKIPIKGCIIKPERGPASSTIAMLDLERPTETRYGGAYDISTDQNICTPKRPRVMAGSCKETGPYIRETPINLFELVEGPPCSSEEKPPPVISRTV